LLHFVRNDNFLSLFLGSGLRQTGGRALWTEYTHGAALGLFVERMFV